MTPRRVPNRSKMAPGSPPRPNAKVVIFFAPFLRLLGGSWGAPGASWGRLGDSWGAPGASWGAPGGHFGLPEASFWSFLAFFFGRRRKNTKTLKFADSCSENQGFGTPRGSKIEPKWLQNRFRGPLGGSSCLLAGSWGSLGLSWRLLGRSWRLLVALGAVLNN